MSVVIERVFGRKKLVECICDQTRLLVTYNLAAQRYEAKYKESLARWDESLLKTLAGN